MMSRIIELRDLQKEPESQDCFFRNFDRSLETNPRKRQQLLRIEHDVQGLDRESWALLRAKAARHFTKSRTGRGWRQAFDRLNEARAHNALVGAGWGQVTFVPEDGDAKRPDLRAVFDGRVLLCEVKTVHVVKGAAFAPEGGLPKSFELNLERAIVGAMAQIDAHPDASAAEKLVYLIVEFDSSLRDIAPVCRSYLDTFAGRYSSREFVVELDLRATF